MLWVWVGVDGGRVDIGRRRGDVYVYYSGQRESSGVASYLGPGNVGLKERDAPSLSLLSEREKRWS